MSSAGEAVVRGTARPRAHRVGDATPRHPAREPDLRQPQPAAGSDRAGRLRHGLHAGALQPGQDRRAVDAGHAAQAGHHQGLPRGDPRAGLRPDAGHPRPGRRSHARQHLQARPLRLSRARAPRADAHRSRQDGRALPARAHAPVGAALRLDRFAVRAARGGAVRGAWSTTSIARRVAAAGRPTTCSGRTSASASTWPTATDRSRPSSARSWRRLHRSAIRRWPRRCTSSARRASGCSC